MDNDIIFADDLPKSTISGMVQRGDIIRLGRGVYTSSTTALPHDVVRHNWLAIAGHLFPRATVTDRSAPRLGPVDGVLCPGVLAGAGYQLRNRRRTLPAFAQDPSPQILGGRER